MNDNFANYDNSSIQNFVKQTLVSANFANYDNFSIQNFENMRS